MVATLKSLYGKEFSQRYVELLEALNKNDTQVHRDLQDEDGNSPVSYQALATYRKGVSPSLYVAACLKDVYPEINLNWLVTGQGDMLLSTTDQNEEVVDYKDLLLECQARLDMKNDIISLLETKLAAASRK